MLRVSQVNKSTLLRYAYPVVELERSLMRRRQNGSLLVTCLKAQSYGGMSYTWLQLSIKFTKSCAFGQFDIDLYMFKKIETFS
jgi:hypothetical protein